MDLQLLSPMYASGDQYFYVLEFTWLRNGNFIVPAQWLTYKGQVKADVFEVKWLPDGTASITTDETILIDTSDLRDTYLDLIAEGVVPKCGDSGQITDLPFSLILKDSADTSKELVMQMPNPN